MKICLSLFCLIEFSDAVLVRAIRSYADNHVGALNFVEGDCITVSNAKKRNHFKTKNNYLD